MLNKNENTLTYKFFNRKLKRELEATSEAHWEVSFDPISDDYTPSEINAYQLFKQWIKRVQIKHPNGLIPIFWFVNVKGESVSTFERMPFQFEHIQDDIPNEDFLTFFTQPFAADTKQSMNWLTLPVIDKLWNSRRADKGSFIQQATVGSHLFYSPTFTYPH